MASFELAALLISSYRQVEIGKLLDGVDACEGLKHFALLAVDLLVVHECHEYVARTCAAILLVFNFYARQLLKCFHFIFAG